MKKPPLKRFPQFYNGRKEILTEEEIKKLLADPFIVEEKLDGSLTIKEHELATGKKVLLMLEDMKYTHSVFYDRLPGRYILVDALHETGHRYGYEEREEISRNTGYPLPPLIMRVRNLDNTFLHNFIEYLVHDLQSGFSPYAREGFVIKSELFLLLGGKYSKLDLQGSKRFDKRKTNFIVGRK